MLKPTYFPGPGYWMLNDPRWRKLKRSEHLVWCAIRASEKFKRNGSMLRIYNALIALRTGLSERAISLAIRRLAAVGVLEVVHGKCTVQNYGNGPAFNTDRLVRTQGPDDYSMGPSLEFLQGQTWMRLSAPAKQCLYVICALGFTRSPTSRIAWGMCVSERAARRALAELREAGVVKKNGDQLELALGAGSISDKDLRQRSERRTPVTGGRGHSVRTTLSNSLLNHKRMGHGPSDLTQNLEGDQAHENLESQKTFQKQHGKAGKNSASPSQQPPCSFSSKGEALTSKDILEAVNEARLRVGLGKQKRTLRQIHIVRTWLRHFPEITRAKLTAGLKQEVRRCESDASKKRFLRVEHLCTEDSWWVFEDADVTEEAERVKKFKVRGKRRSAPVSNFGRDPSRTIEQENRRRARLGLAPLERWEDLG